ncbi:MAG: hypothetical protein KAV87_35695 [Desulfobacteraceae bacterium]|nr:hypothetical protein [Desulfobacteraceae bacterium]
MTKRSAIEPEMSNLLNEAIAGLLKNTFCAMPGVIESYNAEETTAEIWIKSKRIIDEESGQNIDYPKLVDVPILQLTGGTGGINLPIVVGDSCLVLFGDRDIDNWFVTGAAEIPNTRRFHSIADGFALVGFRPLTNQVTRPDYLAASLYKDGTQISVKGNKAAIKNPTTDLLTLEAALISAINSALSSATVVIPAGSSAGTYPLVSVFVPPDFSTLLYNGDEILP